MNMFSYFYHWIFSILRVSFCYVQHTTSNLSDIKWQLLAQDSVGQQFWQDPVMSFCYSPHMTEVSWQLSWIRIVQDRLTHMSRGWQAVNQRFSSGLSSFSRLAILVSPHGNLRFKHMERKPQSRSTFQSFVSIVCYCPFDQRSSRGQAQYQQGRGRLSIDRQTGRGFLSDTCKLPVVERLVQRQDCCITGKIQYKITPHGCQFFIHPICE